MSVNPIAAKADAFVAALAQQLSSLLPPQPATGASSSAASRATFDATLRTLFETRVPVPRLQAYLLAHFDQYSQSLWASHTQLAAPGKKAAPRPTLFYSDQAFDTAVDKIEAAGGKDLTLCTYTPRLANTRSLSCCHS